MLHCRHGFRSRRAYLGMFCAMVFSVSAVSTAPPLSAQNSSKGASAPAFSLRSPDFPNGVEIPKQFTCSGEDLSPTLEWSGAPAGTKSLALIADDPDDL
jgi:phosphatidylethanolamine-binding protein (PEBP) family uncharacterized protein